MRPSIFCVLNTVSCVSALSLCLAFDLLSLMPVLSVYVFGYVGFGLSLMCSDLFETLNVKACANSDKVLIHYRV